MSKQKSISINSGCLFTAVLTALFIAYTPTTAWALNCNVGTFVFYSGGGIKSCELNGNHRFWTPQDDSVTCIDGKQITQYPGGKLESCTIDTPHVFGGDRCAPGRIEFHQDGKVRTCTTK